MSAIAILSLGLMLAGDAVGQPVVRDHRTGPATRGGQPPPVRGGQPIRGGQLPIRGGQVFQPALPAAPNCSPADLTELEEVITKYQGLKGRNPSVPSTYRLIATHKASGFHYATATNPFFGENWYPIRTEKQILTGIVHDFGVHDMGDESDWNIHILPDPGFEDFVSDAIPYRASNWHGFSDEWFVTADGRITIEAEITPDERRFGNPWFNNRTGKTALLKRRLSVYGPFVFEESHGNRPEIHPAEQMWWREGDDVTMALLMVDDSNRFKRPATRVVTGPDGRPQVIAGDYSARRATPDHQPWVREKGQEAELSLAFQLNPQKDLLKVEVQASDDLDFFSGADYPDPTQGDRHSLSYEGAEVLTVLEEGAIDRFVGVSFRNVCFNPAKANLQGFVVLKTAIGNGNGKEGFVALRLKQTPAPIDARPAIVLGDLANTWKVLGPFDDQVQMKEIISSDREGKGVVDGLVDFNGNGKTDLFAAKGGRWLVLYDGKGSWQHLNTSSVPVGELRFGDIDGDRKTDILRVSPAEKVQVCYGGTGQWTDVTDAGEQSRHLAVADFNGDGRTDIVYTKFFPTPGAGVVLASGQNLRKAKMYVKFSAKGSWRELNELDFPGGPTQYFESIRFGHFNGDRVSDVFRFDKGRFGVYWNGTGDFKELARPPAAVKPADLLFVTGQTQTGLTDVVHIDPATKKWTVYYGGKPGSLPLTLKHADPLEVRFADLDADPAVEPFAKELVSMRPTGRDLQLVLAPKAVSEPVVVPRYVPGSLKRAAAGGRTSLVASMDLVRYPGSEGTARRRDELASVTSVREKASGRVLRFAAGTTGGGRSDHGQTIGRIEGVSLTGATENDLQIAYSARPAPDSYKLPAQGITAVTDAMTEAVSGAGRWDDWKPFLSPTARRERARLLASAPGSISQVQSVSFELLPMYSTLEKGKVRLVEMDAIAKEMNDIAYGADRNRAGEIFGAEKPFTIEWNVQLTNVRTGRKVSIASPGSAVSDGRWPKSKFSFRFPQSPDLLKLQVTARIKDRLGNKSAEPIEHVFWSQRIEIQKADEQLSTWLSPIKDDPAAGHRHALIRATYLAEDGVLTPAEVSGILR